VEGPGRPHPDFIESLPDKWETTWRARPSSRWREQTPCPSRGRCSRTRPCYLRRGHVRARLAAREASRRSSPRSLATAPALIAHRASPIVDATSPVRRRAHRRAPAPSATSREGRQVREMWRLRKKGAGARCRRRLNGTHDESPMARGRRRGRALPVAGPAARRPRIRDHGHEDRAPALDCAEQGLYRVRFGPALSPRCAARGADVARLLMDTCTRDLVKSALAAARAGRPAAGARNARILASRRANDGNARSRRCSVAGVSLFLRPPAERWRCSAAVTGARRSVVMAARIERDEVAPHRPATAAPPSRRHLSRLPPHERGAAMARAVSRHRVGREGGGGEVGGLHAGPRPPRRPGWPGERRPGIALAASATLRAWPGLCMSSAARVVFAPRGRPPHGFGAETPGARGAPRAPGGDRRRERHGGRRGCGPRRASPDARRLDETRRPVRQRLDAVAARRGAGRVRGSPRRARESVVRDVACG